MSRLSDAIIAWKNSLTEHTDTALNAHGGTPEVEVLTLYCITIIIMI